MDLIVLGNFDVVTNTSSPIFTRSGTWYDYFSGESISVTDTLINIELQPGEFHIYTTKKLETPEEDLLTDIHEISSQLPASYNNKNFFHNSRQYSHSS